MKTLSVAHRKKLHDRAGGECAFPACVVREPLQEAHIFARSDGGPRANPTMLQEMREVYENFIIVCANHHGVIDRDENRYTVAAVKQMKTAHERDIAARGGEKLVGINSRADHGSTSIAAGRDVNNYYAAPVPQQERPAVSDEPTFDLTFRAATDDFVHALVTNKTTPAEFHVDVIEVVTEETQTTPYPVKWHGFPGEDRRVVREALIDLAEVVTPRHPELRLAVRLRGGYRVGKDAIRKRVHNAEIIGDWESGYFHLFSFSKQDGWPARGVDTHAADVPDELRFFRERISLTVRATRLDTQEEITRRVSISFVVPALDERSRQWIVSEHA